MLQKLRHFSSSAAGERGEVMSHFIFGANTDVGKTVISAGLMRACGSMGSHYVKPLQCGGSDQGFIQRHSGGNVLTAKTLFEWETPTSPHTAAILESAPVSDEEVATTLRSALSDLGSEAKKAPIWVETAGGVLSPSSASPSNDTPFHATSENGWGWMTQGDLYSEFSSSVGAILVGDGRLGGISATLSSLESLLSRGYNVAGLVLIETEFANRSALQEFARRSCPPPFGSKATMFQNPDASIISLPELPPEPEPLMEWYASPEVSETLGSFVNDHLLTAWNNCP
eukprot:Nitzschia sp. Nitz4//scaffold79_size90958//417//1344//NITZ4_005005-RA/size90958-augustus-gene-0.165-mRNA-1//1//CDS//3329558189//6367//frame0